VPPRVRFFDRTGAATPPSGMGGIWGRFWAVGRRTKESRRKRVGRKRPLASTNARSAGVFRPSTVGHAGPFESEIVSGRPESPKYQQKTVRHTHQERIFSK
jgi:hypothetical protein